MIVDVCALLTIVVYVLVCPYTKVEESFNMQAIYDHLHFGLDIASYDHLQFPGVVPRTFLGSLAVSAVSFPFVAAAKAMQLEGVFQQMIVRIALGTLTWLALVRLRRAVQTRFSRRAAQLFALFTALQFHLCFYASRTLPNTFAVLLAALSFAMWLERRPVAALQILGAATVVVRCDMLILVASLALTALLGGEVAFFPTLLTGVATCAAALAATVAVDSFFWQRWLWPEGVVLFFNAVENRSALWGVSPWHWYVSAALPKALTFTLPWVGVCALLALLGGRKAKASDAADTADATDWDALLATSRAHCRSALYFLAPAVLFVGLYSYLPHKELRFVLPALPLFTVAAAVAADRLLALAPSAPLFPLSLLARGADARPQPTASWRWRALARGGQLALLASWGLMLLCSHALLLAAQHNYPGGEALEHLLHHFVRSEAAHHMHRDARRPAAHAADQARPRLEPTFVHVDNLAATTGVTRFLQERFVHHRHLRPTRERATAAARRQVLPTQYAPHAYLNALPGHWRRVLAAEQAFHDAFLAASEPTEQSQSQAVDWVVAEDLLVYSKEEALLDVDKTDFDFLVTEQPDEFLQSGQFVLREAIAGFDRMRLTRFGPQPVLKNKLFILENAYPHVYAED
jgi:alpha-1,6-mannosyltransferase